MKSRTVPVSRKQSPSCSADRYPHSRSTVSRTRSPSNSVSRTANRLDTEPELRRSRTYPSAVTGISVREK